MGFSDPSAIKSRDTDAVETWPGNLKSVHKELEKAQHRLIQYKAALRLATTEISRRNRGIIALTTFAYQASRAADLTSLLKLALIHALNINNAQVGAIVLIDPTTKALTLSIQKGLTKEFADVLTGQQLEQEAFVLMPHLVAGVGALLEYDTAEEDEERSLLNSGKLTSLVSLPLQFDSRLLGALLVGLQDKQKFKTADLSLLMALSQDVAVALEGLQLREGLWHTFETLLDNSPTHLDLQEVNQTDFILNAETPLELPPVPPNPPQPADDDLEQLLAAMMEAEDEVQQQNMDLQTINGLAEKINHTLDLKDILASTVNQTKLLLSCDSAWVYLVNENDMLEMQAHTGLSTTYVRGMYSLEPGSGLEGRVVTKNKALFVEALSTDSVNHKIWVDKEGLEALAAVPITRPGQLRPERAAGRGALDGSHVIGVLVVGSRENKSWGPREARMLTSIANLLAPTIENAQLYAQVQEDQAGLKVGNEILRSVNDMLLEKNAFLEGFIQDDLGSSLKQVSELLGYLQDENPQSLSRTFEKDVAKLQQIVAQLSRTTQETNLMNKALDQEFDRALERKEQARDYIGSTKPIRLDKAREQSGEIENVTSEIEVTMTNKNGQPSDEPAAETKSQDSSSVPNKALSFEEAVSAGLVPKHILNREKD